MRHDRGGSQRKANNLIRRKRTIYRIHFVGNKTSGSGRTTPQ